MTQVEKDLRTAMYWEETWHGEAYCFGSVLIPFLKNQSPESSKLLRHLYPSWDLNLERTKWLTDTVPGRKLVKMLKAYESFRERYKSNFYRTRRAYIRRLDRQKSPLPDLFNDINGIKKLLRKQKSAFRFAARVEPGWQKKMKDAGIWDDDKYYFGPPRSVHNIQVKCN